MHVLSMPAPLETRTRWNIDVCNLDCGSIHQGHERVIIVMNLEEGKRLFVFGCSIMLVIFADSRMAPGAKIKSFFMEIIFYSVHSAAVFWSLKQKYRLQFAGLGRKERKVWSRPALCRKRVKSFAIFFACWGVKFDRWVKISARWGKWFEHWVIFARWGERKACNHIVLWILISLLQCDHIIITMKRFVMTFDDTLRDGSSISVANSLY